MSTNLLYTDWPPMVDQQPTRVRDRQGLFAPAVDYSSTAELQYAQLPTRPKERAATAIDAGLPKTMEAGAETIPDLADWLAYLTRVEPHTVGVVYRFNRRFRVRPGRYFIAGFILFHKPSGDAS